MLLFNHLLETFIWATEKMGPLINGWNRGSLCLLLKFKFMFFYLLLDLFYYLNDKLSGETVNYI